MMADNVTYGRVSRTSGAVPEDTEFRTTQSTEAGNTDAHIQHVKLDTGDGTNIQPVSAASLPLPSGASTSALQTTGNSTLSSIQANQTNGNQLAGIKIFDTATSTYLGLQFNAGSPQICAQDYLLALAEGDITGHEKWSRLGYTPTMTTAESDVWSAAGTYVFPAAAQQMEAYSSDNTNDIGTAIFSGTSTGGSTTSLTDTGKDFTAGTAAAAGDCVILDKSGAVPEWGYVTAVSANTLTVGGGFSSGGTGSGRAYIVVDKSATTGAHAVMIEYLNGSYVADNEIVVLNGTTPVDTVQTDLFRIQNVGVIATGSGNKAGGAISIRNTAGTVTYGYITAGYNHSRSSIFTVPPGKTLYIVSIEFSYGYSTNQTHYARLYLRANYAEHRDFITGSIFYPYSEVVCANTSQQIDLRSPLVFPEKVDIRASGISTYAGIASVVMRGWIE